ncbi:MAG: hypothetical protein VYE77_09050 [Planctomycetota bacterium]|nr:hypothetical protein [Planctomycetota bacterium]
MAAFGLIVWWVYQVSPGQVDRVDRAIDEFFTGEPAARLESAVAQVESQPETARAELIELVDDLNEVQPGDRRYLPWRRAMALLVDLSQRADEPAAALEYARVATARNERDFPLRLRLCRMLLADVDLREEGSQKLAELLRLVPGEKALIQLFLEVFRNDRLLAGRALAAYLRLDGTPFWVLRYDGNDALPEFRAMLAEVLQPRYAPHGPFRAEFRLPAGTAGVHFDVPAERHWGFESVRLVREDETGRQVLPLNGSPGLRQQGDLLWIDGGRGALQFLFAERTARPLTFALEADIRLKVPEWLARQLRSERVLVSIDELRGLNYHGDARLLQRWRSAAQMQTPATFYWAGPQGSFSAENSQKVPMRLRVPFVDGIGFDGDFAVPPGCDWIRFDPPLGEGGQFRLQRLDFLNHDGALIVRVAPAAVRGLNDLELDAAGHYQVSGRDPWLRLEVPSGSKTLRVWGVLP